MPLKSVCKHSWICRGNYLHSQQVDLLQETQRALGIVYCRNHTPIVCQGITLASLTHSTQWLCLLQADNHKDVLKLCSGSSLLTDTTEGPVSSTIALAVSSLLYCQYFLSMLSLPFPLQLRSPFRKSQLPDRGRGCFG